MQTRLKTFFAPGYLGDCLALLAGILLTFSFAPFHLYPLALLSSGLLLTAWLQVSPKRAFFRGFLYGLGLFTSGIYWVYISIHTYGNAPPYLAALITGGLIAIMALFPALNGYLLNRYYPTQTETKLVFAFPAIWVLLEWIRSWLCTGFPWLFIGYSQITSPLKGFAPILSIFGVSLSVLVSTGLLVSAIIRFHHQNYRQGFYNIIAVAMLFMLGGYLNTIPWTKPIGEPVKVSLVQGNIPQEIKWSSDNLQTTLDTYTSLSAGHWDSQLVIWPEAAIPLPLYTAQDFLAQIDRHAKLHHTNFITGIPIAMDDHYFNAVILMGEGNGVYLKHRLVPFGEFIPFRPYLQKLLSRIEIPMSDLTADHNPAKPLQVNHLKIATFICYEIAFPEQVLSRDPTVNMLLTVSDDAWFGRSIAQAQHLEMAQMRSLELKRPGLFVSNDGITAVITPDGKIQSAAPTHEAFVLTDRVQPTTGLTPWQRVPMDPIFILIIASLFISTQIQRKFKLAGEKG